MVIENKDTETRLFVARGPKKILGSTKVWKKYLADQFPGFFDENINNAALFMNCLEQGALYAFSNIARKGLNITVPKIRITLNDEDLPSTAFCWDNGKSIWITQSCLQHLIPDNPRKIMKLNSSQDDEVIFAGRLTDYFKLVGVEEGHHSVYLQVKGRPDVYNWAGAEKQTITEHDAQEIEYRALLWQIRYAQQHKLPTVTQRALNQRLNNARQFRKSLTKTDKPI